MLDSNSCSGDIVQDIYILMSFVEETRPTPEEDNNLLEIDINSNDVINL